jgi:hypothetical protein
MGDKKLTDFCIDDHTYLADKLYNSKMIYKWHRGLEMIKRSGVEYDLIMITRPDLWFDLTCWGSFKSLQDFANIDPTVLYSHFIQPGNVEGMEDMTYVASPAAMYEAILGCKYENWNNDFYSNVVYDWHKWLWLDYKNRNIKLGIASPTISLVHCRPICDMNDDTFTKIFFKSRVWRYQIIEHEFADDLAFALKIHGQNIKQEMADFYASEEYRKYKEKQDVLH